MSTSNQLLEQRICTVIRNAGGKLALSSLVYQYENEFQLSFPDYRKLSDFVGRFDSIELQRNPNDNQTYIIKSPTIAAPPTPKTQVMKNNVDENQYKDIEKRIIDVLRKSNNRILLNHFYRKYQDTFNEFLLVPAGIKTRKWFEKFQGIQVEHDKVKHQVHLVLLTQEEKIVRLLQDHYGCIHLSRLVQLYQKKYSEDLLIPMGMRLSQWIRSFTSLILTETTCLELTPLTDLIHDEEDLSHLSCENKGLRIVIDETLEKCVDATTSLSNDIQMINESENVVSQNQSLPINESTLQSDCPSSDLSLRHNLSVTEDVWEIIEDDQKEEMIVDAIQSLGYLLTNTDLETSAILVDKVDVEEKVSVLQTS